MKEADIRKYARLMGELGLTGLEIKDRDSVVRLERAASPAAVPVAVPESSAPAEPADADLIPVCSPLVGTFYSAPAENSEPYVKVGDRVERGTVLCLIEAMKLMNEITAETGGTVAEVCVQNGQVVDYGRALFRIRRDAP